METNTPNEMSSENASRQESVEDVTNVQEVVIDPSDPAHPEHPDHHKHMSALRAAGLSHSAVHHVQPHHRGIDL